MLNYAWPNNSPRCTARRSDASRLLETQSSTRRAFTMVEVVVSTLIVGVMTVAALNTLGVVARSGMTAGNRAIAQGLADDLMAEILGADYREPDTTPAFGPELGEAIVTRAAFDDLDDYDGWNKKPPQARDGTVLADRAEWRRRVTVTHVQPADPSQATAGNVDQGVKRIQVFVEYLDELLVEQVAVRTRPL